MQPPPHPTTAGPPHHHDPPHNGRPPRQRGRALSPTPPRAPTIGRRRRESPARAHRRRLPNRLGNHAPRTAHLPPVRLAPRRSGQRGLSPTGHRSPPSNPGGSAAGDRAAAAPRRSTPPRRGI